MDIVKQFIENFLSDNFPQEIQDAYWKWYVVRHEPTKQEYDTAFQKLENVLSRYGVKTPLKLPYKSDALGPVEVLEKTLLDRYYWYYRHLDFDMTRTLKQWVFTFSKNTPEIWGGETLFAPLQRVRWNRKNQDWETC